MATQGTERKIALLSISPRFADLIIKGTKKVEFRRTRFRTVLSHVVVYATRPVQGIVGFFDVSHIDEENPANLWDKYHEVSGLEEEEFQSYFDSCLTGVAIGIGRVRQLREPLPLCQLDREYSAPQSFMYLSADKFDEVRKWAASVRS